MEEVKESIVALSEKGAAETDKPPSCKSYSKPGDFRFYLIPFTDRRLRKQYLNRRQKAPSFWEL